MSNQKPRNWDHLVVPPFAPCPPASAAAPDLPECEGCGIAPGTEEVADGRRLCVECGFLVEVFEIGSLEHQFRLKIEAELAALAEACAPFVRAFNHFNQEYPTLFGTLDESSFIPPLNLTKADAIRLRDAASSPYTKLARRQAAAAYKLAGAVLDISCANVGTAHQRYHAVERAVEVYLAEVTVAEALGVRPA